MTTRECLRAAFVRVYPDRPTQWIDDAMNVVDMRMTSAQKESIEVAVPESQQEAAISHFANLISTPGELFKAIDEDK